MKKLIPSFLMMLIIAGMALLLSATRKAPVVRLVLDARAILGEGALWHPKQNVLYWIDINGNQFHCYQPKTGTNKTFDVGAKIGTVVPAKKGGALVALQSGIHHLDTQTGKLSLLTKPFSDSMLRFNDGKCDPAGRFWVGTLAMDGRKKAAALYRFDKNKSLHQMLDSVSVSNGICWSHDKKTMYYIDTPTGTVQAFDYDNASGVISRGRVVITIPKETGFPDGMTIDLEGKLWIALWGGAAVGRFDPQTGKLLAKIEVPAPFVTSCAFGGKDLKTLFITTARVKMSTEDLQRYPYSGGLFAIEPGVAGVPANFYEGK